ncbi:hypothetical protein HPCPY1662_0710 [Helicobacter pylori CPY1662]|nr:hypothetical protein HPCPY1662_0710 [Helicobacter pylori CPY1662]
MLNKNKLGTKEITIVIKMVATTIEAKIFSKVVNFIFYSLD